MLIITSFLYKMSGKIFESCHLFLLFIIMKRSRFATPSSTTELKQKRVRLSIAQKREVITLLKDGKSTTEAALQFGIGEQTVRDIKKRESQLDVYEIFNSFF